MADSCINGFDGSIMGGINSMPQYQSFFGLSTDGLGSTTGIVFAIYNIGNLVGAFMAGPASDIKGRRFGMALGSLLILIGTAIQSSAMNIGQFLGGRFICGVGVSIVTSAAPAYVVEMSHPSYRGAMTGAYNTMYYIGAIVATWMMTGTVEIQSSLAWRLPIILQAVPSGLVLLLVFFLPESPRWLVSVGRRSDAVDVLAKYHGDGDASNPVVMLELKEFDEQISQTGSDKRWWDYGELVNNRNNRYRLMLVIFVGFFGQWSGNGLVTYFLPEFLQGAGITDAHRKLVLNAVQPVLSFAAAVCGIFMVDRSGRRKMFLYITGSLIGFWVIIAATSGVFANTGNGTAATASVVFIYLFQMAYSFGYTPLQALYPAEVLAYSTRAKGLGMYSFFVNIAALVNTYGVSLGVQKIAWKFYIIYAAWCFVETVIIYLTFPETKGRTLEELDEIFSSKNPVRASLQKKLVTKDKSGEIKAEALSVL